MSLVSGFDYDAILQQSQARVRAIRSRITNGSISGEQLRHILNRINMKGIENQESGRHVDVVATTTEMILLMTILLEVDTRRGRTPTPEFTRRIRSNLIRRAQSLYSLDDYSRALLDCQRAMQSEVPNSPDYDGIQSRDCLANCLLENGSRQSSQRVIELLTEALDIYTALSTDSELAGILQPKHSAPFVKRRATAYRRLGQFESAEEDISRAIELIQGEEGEEEEEDVGFLNSFYLTRGTIRFQRSDFENAEADFTEALRLLPGNLVSFLSRAKFYMTQSRWPNALDDLNSVLFHEASLDEEDADDTERADPSVIASAFFLRALVRLKMLELNASQIVGFESLIVSDLSSTARSIILHLDGDIGSQSKLMFKPKSSDCCEMFPVVVVDMEELRGMLLPFLERKIEDTDETVGEEEKENLVKVKEWVEERWEVNDEDANETTMSDEENRLRTCSACGMVANKRLSQCSRCKSARYCSVQCQRGHWTIHRVECRRIVMAKQSVSQ